MRIMHDSKAWWGPPRKFDTHFEERKISWLELFFDLVYVIAISRITHILGNNFSWSSLFDYALLFSLIFWGWLNGSLYHDLHGNSGLRTRLMTLWQMMIISALSVTLGHTDSFFSGNTICVLMAMQLFITYQWWSVGIYDKNHRQYSLPYTILYLVAFAAMGITLYLPEMYTPALMLISVVCSYLPPFVANVKLRKSDLELSLSSSMTERLGLFAIIVFGEVVLGVVNGFSESGADYTGLLVIEFAMAMAIVFALWWLFFTLISNRDACKGFVNASLLELLYLPALIALGVLAAMLAKLLSNEFVQVSGSGIFLATAGVFVWCISVMMKLLIFPESIAPIRKKVRHSLSITSVVLVIYAFSGLQLHPVLFLFSVLLILVTEIWYLNHQYYKLGLE